jgi:hypothetical protein
VGKSPELNNNRQVKKRRRKEYSIHNQKMKLSQKQTIKPALILPYPQAVLRLFSAYCVALSSLCLPSS